MAQVNARKFGKVRSSSATLLACSALALFLSACESTGGARFAGVGSGAGSGGSGSGGSGTDGSGGGGSGSGGQTGGGGAGSGGGGSGSGGGGTGGGGAAGSGGSIGAALEQVSPVLVTAGNAVLGVADGQATVTTPIATALPVAQPVTGAITRVLTDTGTVLVDAGQGRTLLLQGAQGVVGDLVTINVGGQSVTNGLDGTAGAIGVGLLGDTQPTGTVATAGVLNAGNTVLASVNGVADVRVTNITAPTGGVADNLLNVALGGNQLIGNGDPALVNANLLPGGAALPGSGAAGGLLTPVTDAIGGGVGGGDAGGGLISTVQNVAGGLLAPVGGGTGATAGATVDAGATASAGGPLAPITGAVGNTLNSVTSGLGLIR